MSTMVATQPETTPKAEITPEELLAMPDEGHYELIDGELKERSVSVLSNLVAAEVNRLLSNHSLRAGVRLVWVVYPDIHIVNVYRADGTMGRFRAHDELSGEDVVPGFRCKVDDLFPIRLQGESEEPTPSDAVSPSPAY